MKKINKEDYLNFYEIFKEIDCYVGVLGVLDQLCNGEIYSDDAKHPTLAIMLTEDGYYLAGEFNNPELNQSLKAFTESDDFPEYAGFLFNASRIEDVKKLFGEKLYQIVERDNFELEQEHFIPADTKSLSFDVITRSNLTSFSDYTDYKTLHDGCLFFWNEYKPNTKMNYCIALTEEQSLVSKCIVCQESISENCCELDVETIERYRQKGFGLMVASKTIEKAFFNGYQKVCWCCDKDNFGSRRIAHKLGFKQVEESYLVWFDKKL